jgi:hypothetical protein
MQDEIINKVAQSGLVTINLEDFYAPGDRVLLDIKPWLYEELILKEKEFRQYIKDHNWQQYSDKYVAVTCTADAIVPTWAYMLVAIQLAAVAKDVFFGGLNELEEHLFQKQLSSFNPAMYKDQRVVIKGCSDREVPVSVFMEITRLLQPYVKSIMYGEPCSTVPVFKRKD